MCTSNEIKLHLEVEIKLLFFKGKGLILIFEGNTITFRSWNKITFFWMCTSNEIKLHLEVEIKLLFLRVRV